MSYLRNKTAEISRPITDILLIPEQIPVPSAFEMVLKCLRVMAELLAREENLTLAHVVDELQQRRLVLNSENSENSDDNMLVSQFVFICFGLLTFLFSPNLHPSRGKLEINVSESGLGVLDTRQPNLEAQRIYNSSMKDILRSLCHRTDLATLIPQPLAFSLTDSQPSGTNITHKDFEGIHYIASSNLNFYTLSKFTKLKVHWTEQTSKHLELDTLNRGIYLFRHPSFCVLVCQSFSQEIGPVHTTFLDRYVNISCPCNDPTNLSFQAVQKLYSIRVKHKRSRRSLQPSSHSIPVLQGDPVNISPSFWTRQEVMENFP